MSQIAKQNRVSSPKTKSSRSNTSARSKQGTPSLSSKNNNSNDASSDEDVPISNSASSSANNEKKKENNMSSTTNSTSTSELKRRENEKGKNSRNSTPKGPKSNISSRSTSPKNNNSRSASPKNNNLRNTSPKTSSRNQTPKYNLRNTSPKTSSRNASPKSNNSSRNPSPKSNNSSRNPSPKSNNSRRSSPKEDKRKLTTPPTVTSDANSNPKDDERRLANLRLKLNNNNNNNNDSPKTSERNKSSVRSTSENSVQLETGSGIEQEIDDEEIDYDDPNSIRLRTIVSVKPDESLVTETFQAVHQYDISKDLEESEISCRIYQYNSIADSVLRGFNMFREAQFKPCLQEDDNLFQIAMEQSKMMANGKEFDKAVIAEELKKYPFVYYCVNATHICSRENAFTTVVNNWTTDPVVSKQILENFNCAGIGVWMNKADEVFFTMILALRSNIGTSYYSGSSLKSILLAEKCLKMVNSIRHDDFGLLPLKLDLRLCDLARSFAKMSREELSRELIEDKVGICSTYRLGFGAIPFKNYTIRKIVENWANKYDKTKTVFGDYNRVGYGFHKLDDESLYSVCIYSRTIHAGIIDGTETVVDGPIIANQIWEDLNEFREQHSLPAVNLDYDLCNVAQEHAEYIANGRQGPDPLQSDYYLNSILPNYEATDTSHMRFNEMSRAPKAFMKKWRNNCDCISVILNQIDDIGIGVCFDKDYICHITTIVASKGNEAPITNVIVKF